VRWRRHRHRSACNPVADQAKQRPGVEVGEQRRAYAFIRQAAGGSSEDFAGSAGIPTKSRWPPKIVVIENWVCRSYVDRTKCHYAAKGRARKIVRAFQEDRRGAVAAGLD